MVALTEEQKAGLNTALNEATLLGVEVDTDSRVVAATFDVLTLPPEGPPPDDRRVLFIFYPAGRVAASLRSGRWDDLDAEIVPFEIGKLLNIVEKFKEAIYGWEFFDQEEDFEEWKERLSLDYRSGEDGNSQSITLSQEGLERHLDLRIWFDQLQLKNAAGQEIDIAEFIAGGRRWWEDLRAHGKRSKGEGIVSLTHKSEKPEC